MSFPTGPPSQRYALLIGNCQQLPSAANDVALVRKMLGNMGFDPSRILTLLVGDESGPCDIDDFLARLETFMTEVRQSAVDFVVLISTHGTQVKYQGRLADALVVFDRLLIDDDLHRLLVEPLRADTKAVIFIDCCHGGDLLELSVTNDEGESRESEATRVTTEGSRSDRREQDGAKRGGEGVSEAQPDSCDRSPRLSFDRLTPDSDHGGDVISFASCSSREVAHTARYQGIDVGLSMACLASFLEPPSPTTSIALNRYVLYATRALRGYHQSFTISQSRPDTLSRFIPYQAKTSDVEDASGEVVVIDDVTALDVEEENDVPVEEPTPTRADDVETPRVATPDNDHEAVTEGKASVESLVSDKTDLESSPLPDGCGFGGLVATDRAGVATAGGGRAGRSEVTDPNARRGLSALLGHFHHCARPRS
jgi:hypothetical protein